MGECMVQTVTSFLKCLLEGQGIWVIIRLRNLGYYNLDQVGLFIGSGHSWLKVVDLKLEAGVAEECKLFIQSLNHCGVFLSTENDRLVWSLNVVDGHVTSKLAYEATMSQNLIHDNIWWYSLLWKREHSSQAEIV